MAVREVFCGGELDSVIAISGTPAASALDYDSAYSACSINLVSRSYRADFVDEDMAPTTVATSEALWVHFFGGKGGGGGASDSTLFTVYDANGRACFRLHSPSVVGSSNYRVQWNSSATATPTWVTAASYDDPTAAASYFDVAFLPGGGIILFFGDERKSQGTATIVGSAKSHVVFGPASAWSGQGGFASQICVTENKPTVGSRIWTRKATANGAVQEMTGTYTSLAKTSINDATAVISDTAGQTATYTYQDVTTPTEMEWGEMWLWTRAREDGSSPTNLKGVARIGGTDYTTANVPGISAGYGPLPARFPTNPATSAKWDDTAFNGAELGMESAA